MTTEELAERCRAILGPAGVLTEPEDTLPFCTSWGGAWRGRSLVVLLPRTTEEVAESVRICAEASVPIVPQGGNTNLTGSAQPHATGTEAILSLKRMRKVRDVDSRNNTITVDAGVVLAEAQAAAEQVGRLLPISLASEGSCQIGGLISTNAGGTQVLRYGNMRQLVLGLEVVLPDGQVLPALRGLRKDSAGYDLKQLFIGAEGTLGIITGAVLRLSPRPSDVGTALLAIPDVGSGVSLLMRMGERLGERISAFEIMRGECLDHVSAVLPDLPIPLPLGSPWYVLVEVSGQDAPGHLAEPLQEALAEALENGTALDGVMAGSEDQRRRLWSIREHLADAQSRAGTGFKHDISVPVSRVADFIAEADARLDAAFPGIRHFAFGHLGDGNIHYNPIAPVGWTRERMGAELATVNDIVHRAVVGLGGSISAEHGIGQLRAAELPLRKSAVELELMRRVKQAIDPRGLMNPGKVLLADPM